MKRQDRSQPAYPARGLKKARPTRVGRPRLDDASADSEARICEVSLDLFAERGFSAVTTKDIADATGFNPALIYYYFNSKEELFLRAVTLAVERAFYQFQLVREDFKSPRAIIYGWLENHITEHETILKLIKIAIDYGKISKRDIQIDEAIKRFYERELEVLQLALAEGVRRRDFRNVDVEETARFISTYLDGVFARSLILHDFEPKSAIAELRFFLNAYLDRKMAAFTDKRARRKKRSKN